MNIEWVLEKLLEGGRIDEAQQVEIEALRRDLNKEIAARETREREEAERQRQRRSSILPNVWQAMSAIAAIAAILISLHH